MSCSTSEPAGRLSGDLVEWPVVVVVVVVGFTASFGVVKSVLQLVVGFAWADVRVVGLL